MDVQCERCKTEYEFDDALISARGTTVRCTHCGHQFKVRRPGTEASTAAPLQERWVVTRAGGGEPLVFHTLRELQKAILAKQVGRSDSLAHGDGPPRGLGSITELEPFFEGRTSSSRPPPPPAGAGGSGANPLPPPPRTPNVAIADGAAARRMGTDPGVGASFPRRPPSNPAPATLRKDSARPIPPPGPLPGGTPATLPPVRSRIDTLRPPAHAPTAAPPPAPEPFALTPTVAAVRESRPPPVSAAPVVAVGAPAEAEPPTLQRPPHAPGGTTQIGVGPEAPELSSPLPAPTVPRRHMASSIDEDAMADAMRRERMSFSDADAPYGAPRRRRIGGWIIAFALLAGVVGVGYVVARPYLAPSASATTQALDPRAVQLLGDGEKALADGNLDLAKEDFDKASMVAEKDPRTLLDLARLAAARADVDWLRLLLLPPSAPDRGDTQTRMKDEVDRAKTTADAALAAAPDDPNAIRAKVDALRIAGERDPARALVSKIINNASQPETAYVLAALDLAEPDPSWPTAIQRLRLAAQGEGGAGRARAALIYALARSGDKDGARQELTKLQALTRPHPLVSLLATYVHDAKAKPDAGPSASGSTPTVDVSSLPPGKILANDGRTPMQQAIAALQSGDNARARAIYQAMLANNPSDSQALCGMGDVSRASGDTAGAIRYYKQTLSVNPNYLPAMIGLADVYYGSGQQGAAVALYKQIVDSYPEGSYPAYVKERAGASAPPPAPTATATASASDTATQAASSNPAPTATDTGAPSTTTSATPASTAAPSATSTAAPSAAPPAPPPSPAPSPAPTSTATTTL